jgi:hypothetical protein
MPKPPLAGHSPVSHITSTRSFTRVRTGLSYIDVVVAASELRDGMIIRFNDGCRDGPEGLTLQAGTEKGWDRGLYPRSYDALLRSFQPKPRRPAATKTSEAGSGTPGADCA